VEKNAGEHALSLLFLPLLTIWLNCMVKVERDISTEQKILEAARQVFFDKGMAGARMQDIADAAGINKAMLHYYFRNKEKLFQTIFTEAFENFFPKLSSIVDSGENVLTKLEMLCVAYINQIQSMPYLPLFILSEANYQPEAFLKKMWGNRKPPVKAFINMIETAVNEGKIKRVDPFQLIMNIVSLSIFPFMAKPLMQYVTGINKKQYDAMMEERKKMVPWLIIQSVKNN
jgi:TetR/AcrR family transcriptional regulator